MRDSGEGQFHLLLVETGGNQAYIFETARLREAIGGSQIVFEVAQRGEGEARERGGHCVMRASGKGAWLFADASSARATLEALSFWAAENGPGLDLCGVVVPHGGDLRATLRRAWAELEVQRGVRMRPELRHRLLPWNQPCDHSGLPVVHEGRNPREWLEQDKWLSAPVRARRRRSTVEAARKRIEERLEGGYLLDWRLEEESEGGLGWDWLAIVHADGNGLGRVFLGLDAVVEQLHGQGEYRDESREVVSQAFSEALEDATWRAFRVALDEVARALQGLRLPVYPLLVGGDDLALICRGDLGLLVASRYLEAFERETSSDGRIRAVRKAALGSLPGLPDPDHQGFRACAGVAIVKPHFPFSMAYQLAEKLCASAKDSVRQTGGSALDWHAVLDASPPTLETTRARLHSADGRSLTRRPYLVGTPPQAAAGPHFAGVGKAVRRLRSEADGDRQLPSGPMHALRKALFLSTGECAREVAMLRSRLGDAFDEFLLACGATGGTPWDSSLRSGCIDAIDHQNFFTGLA